jgi:hypothetical protein
MSIRNLEKEHSDAYSWVEIPDDLPKSNLFLCTAKTTNPSIHPEKDDLVRILTEEELSESARSLARRPICRNHEVQDIPKAFTIDAQWNIKTKAVECLFYVPDEYRDRINAGLIKKVSVEYPFRRKVSTELGTEFMGVIFDRLALVEGRQAGDKLSEIRNCEQEGKMLGSIDGEIIGVLSENTNKESEKKVEEKKEEVKENLAPKVEETKPIIEEKKPEIKTPEVIPEPKIIEKIVEKEIIKDNPVHVARITELETFVTNLQNNAKLFETEKATATKEAYIRGKQEVIKRVKNTLPDGTMLNMNIRNSTSVLVDGVRKVLYEMEHK